jgi:transposase
MASTTILTFLGIDIAAASFTASWSDGASTPTRPLTFEQSPDGYAALQARLATTGTQPASTLAVLEATGSYWVSLALALHEAGFQVSVVNPAHVHHFARSLPRRAKTDPLDAQLLVAFARERQPPRWSPPPAVYHELRQRLTAREALREMRQQARNHRHALAQWPVVVAEVQQQLDEVIDDLDTRVKQLEREIAALLTDSAWAESASLLLSISGVGPLTTAWLLVTTLNFTLVSGPEALTAYAGLAPWEFQSGSSVRGRGRLGHTGNRRLRTALYLATLTATKYNPALKAFYERLVAAGKPKTVARCATARKLAHLAWAVVQKHRPFDPAYHLREVKQA